MSDFTAGLAMRLDAAAQALHAAYALEVEPDFAPADIRRRARGPVNFAPEPAQSFAPEPVGPRSFAPADPEVNPTEGWDLFEPTVEADHEFVDPVAAAHAAGYAEGFSAALAEADAREADQAALLARLGEALRSTDRVDRERMAAQLRRTVLFLVTKVVGEAGVSEDLLARRVDAATELLADAAESALLRLNPEDMPLVEGRLPATVFAAGDPHVERGGFVLESASTIVEDGPGLWLDQLATAIDRVALPC